MTGIMADLRYGLRRARRSSGIVPLATGSLAVGIGSLVALLSIARTVLFAPLPVPRGDDIVSIRQLNPQLGGLNAVSPGSYVRLAASSRSLIGIGASASMDRTLTGHGRPIILHGSRVTPSFLSTLAVQPSLGRIFTDADAVPADPSGMILGENREVILSYETWMRALGASPAIVGQSITLDGQVYRIVGVMPKGFALPAQAADFWTPLVFGAVASSDWGTFSLAVLGRVRPGVPMSAVQAELNVIASRLWSSAPQVNARMTFPVESLKSSLVGGYKAAVVSMLGITAAMLLLICANLGTLLLARGLNRTAELAIRSALGCSRVAVMRPIVIESVIVAGLGGLLGCLLAPVLLRGLVTLAPLGVSLAWSVQVDPLSLIIGFGAAALSGVVFGIVPAFHLAQIAEEPRTLMSGRGLVGSRVQRRFQGPLVTAQVALAVVLVASTFAFGAVYRALASRPLGFDPSGVVDLDVNLPSDTYRTPESIIGFATQATGALEHLPGVTAVAAAVRLPVIDSVGGVWCRVGASPPQESDGSPEVTFDAVTPLYFTTLGIPLRKGRGFEGAAGMEPTAVVSEAFVRQFFGAADPIGQYVTLTAWPKTPRKIVGVVGDVLQGGIRGGSPPAIYVSYDQITGFRLPNMHLVVRGRAGPANLATTAQARLWQLDPFLAFASAGFLRDRLDSLLRDNLIMLWLVAMFGVLGLSLACSGAYAVAALGIAQQTREIGIRAALGATPQRLWRVLFGHASIRMLTGVGAGAALVILLAWPAQNQWNDARAISIGAILAPTVVLLALASLSAVGLPLWLATRRSPAASLASSDA